MKSRIYDKEFKLNAVSLYEAGKSMAQVCKDLGIPKSTFSGWLKEYTNEGKDGFDKSLNVKKAYQKLYEAERKIKDITLERDILKKALAIFSRQK